jgi:hypothetical protein
MNLIDFINDIQICNFAAMVAGKHTFSHFKYNYSEPKSMFY